MSQLILKSFTAALRASRKSSPPVRLLPFCSSASTDWHLGSRHIFLSEGARQQLEMMRSYRRNAAALLIQSVWRGLTCRRRWPQLKRSLYVLRSQKTRASAETSRSHTPNAPGSRPRPQPISGTPPPDACDKVVEKTCTLFGMDLVSPQFITPSTRLKNKAISQENAPPVPPSRAYTVAGNAKLGYPQTRIMKMNFPSVHSAGQYFNHIV